MRNKARGYLKGHKTCGPIDVETLFREGAFWCSMGSTTVAIPASTAGKLADAAANDVSRQLEEGREATASHLGRAASELIHAWNEADGESLVEVDMEYVSAAMTCRAASAEVRDTVRPILKEAGWANRHERLLEGGHDNLMEEVESFLAE